MGVRVENLSKRFGGLQALDGVSLEADSGAVTAIIGPNGAGKTTLINCLSGVVKPDSGRIIVGGTVATDDFLARAIGLGITRTFQNGRLFDRLSVLEQVVLARQSYCRIRGGSPNDRRNIKGHSLAMLERVGLARLANLTPGEMSYGERRRLEIARGLATAPGVFLLDEPAAGSTAAEQLVLAGLIQEIAASGVAVVLIEHHMDLVARVSSKVVVLNFGQVIMTGPIADVRADPRVISAYLGTAA